MAHRVLDLAVTLLVASTLMLTQTSFGRTQTEPEDLGDSTSPVWSPTGQLIAFVSTKFKPEIFVTSPDGSGRHQLTRGAPGIKSYSPAWSTDGRRIVFVTGSPGLTQISVMNSDGSDQKQLTSGHENRSPAWSPDGRWIAFTSNRTGNDELFIMAPDGSQQRSVTPGMSGVDLFSWAPDSRRVVVSTRKTEFITLSFEKVGTDGRPVVASLPTDYDIMQIHLTNVDGGAPRALTNPGSFPTQGTASSLFKMVVIGVGDSKPAWSPDGSRITFVSTRDHSQQIYIMKPDGNSQTRLTSAGESGYPVWSPDGQRIAFLSNQQIYVMNADGSQQVRLTSGGESDPAWSPDGRRIAYASKDLAIWKIYVSNSDGSGEAHLITGP